jgi:hypothetical protein
MPPPFGEITRNNSMTKSSAARKVHHRPCRKLHSSCSETIPLSDGLRRECRRRLHPICSCEQGDGRFMTSLRQAIVVILLSDRALMLNAAHSFPSARGCRIGKRSFTQSIAIAKKQSPSGDRYRPREQGRKLLDRFSCGAFAHPDQAFPFVGQGHVNTTWCNSR